MYAIIESGGKQYKVKAGDEILLEKINGKAGDKIELKKILFFTKNGETILLQKDLTKVKVKATILEQTKGDKIIVFKYKAKKNYRRKRGHRQLLTKVKIDEIIGVQKEKKETGSRRASTPKQAEAKEA